MWVLLLHFSILSPWSSKYAKIGSVGKTILVEKILLNSEQASKEAEWFWIESSASPWESDKLSFISVKDPSVRITSLAFDHRMIIADALNRIKNIVMYTDVGFHLVNELFTVKELQTEL